jgi:uncharacterized damage-inducible protein DinB
MTTAPAIDPSTAPVAMLYPDLTGELAVTREMLTRVPWEQAEYKPHAKSWTLGQLAKHVAQLPRFVATIAATDVLHYKPQEFAPAEVTDTPALVALFDAECAAMHAAFGSLDSGRLNGSWKMMMGEHALIDGQRAYLLRHMGISHLVHHRAQLGVYLRLLDVAIPGSYGPSADTMR